MPIDLQAFYVGAQQAGLRFIRLLPESLKCPAGTWEDHVISSAEVANDILKKGENVGFLLTGKRGGSPNPLGLWGLEINSQEALTRYADAPFTMMVSAGDPCHRVFLGRLPDPTARRKSRKLAGSHGVVQTGILPGPGSVHPDGSLYTLQIRNPESGTWQPWDGEPIDWSGIPVVDPEPYTPSTMILIPLDEQRAREAALRVPPEWIFWSPEVPLEWNNQAYTSAKGDLGSRKIRADGYIRNRIRYGMVSRSGEEGRKTLLVIAVHLVKYLSIPDEVVQTLLTAPVHGMSKAWNDCCIDADTKKPYPWSAEEITSAIAVAHHYIPTYGVYESQKRLKLIGLMDRMKAFLQLLSLLPEPTDESPSMQTQELYELFLDMYSVDGKEFSNRRFTMALQAAISTGFLKLKNIRRTKKKLRYYQGVSLDDIDHALELSSTCSLGGCAA
ncbi:MAG TPA: hypothetical protein PLE74_12050 [Candidatus Cloacimonadota bacterium]|nr:hypothetical protein [Candidatus Cloacimonadota bacterium]